MNDQLTDEEIAELRALHEKLLLDEISALRALLHRLRGWDHLDTAADGPFWKGEIDKVLGGGRGVELVLLARLTSDGAIEALRRELDDTATSSCTPEAARRGVVAAFKVATTSPPLNNPSPDPQPAKGDHGAASDLAMVERARAVRAAKGGIESLRKAIELAEGVETAAEELPGMYRGGLVHAGLVVVIVESAIERFEYALKTLAGDGS